MYKKHEIGFLGEEIASRYLVNKGFKIICRNFKCKQGEIDIIAKFEEYIVFVEVKTRSYFDYGYPIDAVDKYKQKKFTSATKYFLHIYGLDEFFIRFDVVEVLITNYGYKIRHVEQIF